MPAGTRGKMQRTNGYVRRWLEKNQFEDITFFPHSRFSKDLHINGLEFDGITRKNNTIVFFQCKTNHKISSETLIKYRLFTDLTHCLALWFNKVDYGPLEIYNYNRGVKPVLADM